MSTYFRLGALIEGISTTATSGGTTALTSSSKTSQQFTGTSNQTVTLPDATTLASSVGYARRFDILNRSTGTITVNNFSGSLIGTVSANSQQSFLVTDTSTSAGTWALTNSTGSTGNASVSTADELKMLAGLAGLYYNDGTIVSKPLSGNVEEMGSNFWYSKSGFSTAREPDTFALNGFGYSVAGYNGSYLTNVDKYSDDNNYYLSRAALTVGKQEGATFSVGGFGYSVGGTNSGGVITSGDGYKYTDTTNTWSAISNILTSRFSCSGGTLDSLGYVFGGNNGSTVATAEFYNPTIDFWSAKTSMPAARNYQIPFVLNSAFYLAGAGTSFTNTMYVFDNLTNSYITTLGTLNTGREGGGTAIAGFGIATAGYNGGYLSSTEKYSPDSNVWLVMASSPTSRFNAPNGVHNLNESLYAPGGYNGGGYLTTNEKYVVADYFLISSLKNTSITLSSVLLAVATKSVTNAIPAQIRTDGNTWKNIVGNASTVLKANETLVTKFANYGSGYVVAGSTGGGFTPTNVTQTYSEGTNNWNSNRATSPANLINPAGVMLGGALYVMGGMTTGSGPAVQTNYQYNELTNTFTTKASFSTTARNLQAAFPINEIGYIAGGGDTSTVYALVDAYDPVANSWSSKTAMTAARQGAAGFVLNGRGYAVAGGTGLGGGTGQSNTYQYDVDLNSWASKNTIPANRMEMGGTTLNGFGYATCGRDTTPGPTNTRYKYNDVADSWSSVAGLATSKTLHASWRQAGQIFDAGGRDPNNNATTYAYNDAANTSTTMGSMNQSQADVARSSTTAGSSKVFDLRIGLPAYYPGTGNGTWVARAANLTSRNGTCEQLDGSLFAITNGPATSEKFNLDTNTWRYITSEAIARYKGGCFNLENFLYDAGGYNVGASAITTTANRYDHTTDSWTSVANINNADQNQLGGKINGYGYILGGQNATGGSAANVTQQYNPIANSWTNKASIPGGQSGKFGTSDYAGFLYLYGGANTSSTLTANHVRYDDFANVYTTRTSLPGAIDFIIGAPSVSGVMSIGGSNNDSSFNQTSVNEYKPDANVWYTKTAFPVAEGGQGNSGTILNGATYVCGGNTSVMYQWNTNVSNLVSGVALEVK